MACASQSYNGGNSLPSQQTQLAQDMQSIRKTIFSNSSGTVDCTFNLSVMYTVETNSITKILGRLWQILARMVSKNVYLRVFGTDAH